MKRKTNQAGAGGETVEKNIFAERKREVALFFDTYTHKKKEKIHPVIP